MQEYKEIHSRVISIGKSDSDTKILYLKTQIALSNKFISFPFGCTKTRFQHTDLFNYKLNTISEDCYELIIIRNSINSNNCPHNSKFFPATGWDLELVALNIPDVCGIDFTEKEIYELLPEDYGSVELHTSNLHTADRPIVGIVVPIYSRSEYVEKFLNSIKGSDLTNCIVVLVDESMTKDVNDDKKQVHKLVQDFGNINTTLIKIYKKKHGNMFDSILTGFDLLAHKCDYLSTIDSDTIHKRDWIQKCLKTYEVCKNKNNMNILLSGFNTINTGKHTIVETCQDYVIKNSVGGCHMFFDKSMYYGIIRHTLISHKWDTNIVETLRNRSLFITTNPSVVEHIGYISSGHRESSVDDNTDISVDFYKTNIVLVGGINYLRDRVDKNMYNFFCYLQKNSKYKITFHEPADHEGIYNAIGDNSIVILYTCTLDDEIMKKINCKKAYIMEDLNCTCCYKCNGTKSGCKSVRQTDYAKAFDHVLYIYRTYITTYHFGNPYKHFKFPFHFNENLKFNEENKKYDILLYGVVYKDVYPLRYRLYHLFKKNTNRFNIMIVEKSKKVHKSIFGNDLHTLINQSWLTIATKSINNALLLKYYEISACSSVVCGDCPDLETETYLKDNMIYIDISMTDEQILNTIEEALKDKQRLKELSIKNNEYFCSNYSYARGVKTFDSLVDYI